MKTVLVGGPLLGDRNKSFGSDIVSWKEFEPLITPAIAVKKGKPQRYVLLPHSRFISVLAYKTGSNIATLIPFTESEGEEKEEIVIESVCLATRRKTVSQRSVQDVLSKMDVQGDSEEDIKEETHDSEEVVALVGCRDGTIREFSLNCLNEPTNGKPVDCGPFYVAGPYFHPRRVTRATKNQPILHLTSPSITGNAEQGGLLVYAVAETKGIDDEQNSTEKLPHINVALLRLVMPEGDEVTDLKHTPDGDTERIRVVDRLSCRVGKDRDSVNTLPFRVDSVARPSQKRLSGSSHESTNQCVFVAIARTNSIHIYYEQLDSKQQYQPVTFTMPQTNQLSAFSISTNKVDVTCGHYSGEIRVMNNLLTIVEDYNIAVTKYEHHFGSMGITKSSEKPVHPSKTAITTRVHWHAHPVTSLTYDMASSMADPILYSGGEESVLVTWQLSQGTYRPAHVLPRLALGGIVHIACTDRIHEDSSSGILVYCEDNSIQLFESHNKTLLWKVQGLAARERTGHPTSDACIEADPRASSDIETQLVLTGLPDAPGFMHWYDTARQRVTASIEIAAFNRVSRTEHEDSPLPAPAITNHAFSADGNELITLDETPTENVSIGSKGDGADYGVVTTIRFWNWNDAASSQGKESRVPYILVAAMTYPHGPKNGVSALAISKDGSVACTVSNDEKAFRVWHKALPQEEDEAAHGRVAVWSCRYKVTIPAGYSNLPTHRGGSAFSDDASILAICFGNMITLWDVAEARFLTSLRHLEGDKEAVDVTSFVSTSLLQDLLLTKSTTGVTLQSPFGGEGAFKSWSWGVPEGTNGLIISDAKMVEGHGCVAITLFNSISGQSRVIFIDAATGKAGIQDENGSTATIVRGISGCIRSLGVVGRTQTSSNWSGMPQVSKPPMRFFTLMSTGELLQCGSTDESDSRYSGIEWIDASATQAPTLDISRNEGRKRQRKEAGTMSFTPVDPSAKKMAVEIFGSAAGEGSASEPPPSSDLPSLSGAFVRAFVGRSLSRVKNSSD